MRIAIVIHEFPPYGGGASTAASQIARELVRAGHVVRVITSSVPAHPKRELQSGVEILRIAASRRSRFSPRFHELLSFLCHCWWSLRGLLREFQADGVIAFMAIPSGYVAVRAARRLGVPVVVSLRGSDVPGFSPERIGRLYRVLAERLVRSTLRAAAAIAPNSQHLATLAEQFCPEVGQRMVVVANGIEPEMIADRPAASDGTSFRLVQVGQFIARKRVHLTIEALPRLIEQRIPVRLTLIGGGPLQRELEVLAQRLCLMEVIEFLGPLGRSEIPGVLRGCDLFVNTSRAEGMSNAVLEAMASGLPVLISHNGGDDIVTAAQAGRVLHETTAAEIAQQVAALYKNSAERQEMAVRGIHFARAHSWTDSADAFVKLLVNAIRRGSGQPGVESIPQPERVNFRPSQN